MKILPRLLLLATICASVAYADDTPTRQRPGVEPPETSPYPYTYEAVPDINSSASDFVPVPNRWRQFYTGKWYDPYNQNILKGDLPVFGAPGHEWFFEATLISDTTVERLKIPVPVGLATTKRPGSTDVFGNGLITATITNLVTSFSLIRGNTTFKPPEFEIRVTPVISYAYFDASETGLLRINPMRGTDRNDAHIGFMELFADVHLADISDRYDFISSRLGIQAFQSDFRGFIFADEQPGVRLFGNWDNNKLQYNTAWFARLDKDTNTGVNSTFDSRHQNIYLANFYRQDLFAFGHQVSGSIIYNDDSAGDHGQHYNDNGLLVRPAAFGDERPKNVYSTYLSLNGDGHIGRINTTTSLNYVLGTETHNQISGRSQDISAFMLAQELSYDFDWLRLRGSLFWASGDSDPFDGDATGFDAIFDTPNFAGGDLSYWQRQGIPLIAGGEVLLVSPQSLLPALKLSKEESQSNYVNPGLRLYNVGVDVELTPKLKLITNASYLQFDRTETLEVLRQDGDISREIGFDLSAGLIYRPWLNNNVEIRTGSAVLFPGKGLENLYGDKTLYNFFTNLILEY